MAGWHHRPDGHGFGRTLGVGDGQGGLACCGPWGHEESDVIARLNNKNMTDKQCRDSLHGQQRKSGKHRHLFILPQRCSEFRKQPEKVYKARVCQLLLIEIVNSLGP